MITIISGPVNCGKTRMLEQMYNINKCGDGFSIAKLIVDQVYKGQLIRRLSDGREVEFSYRKGCIPDHWDELVRYGQFSFSKSGFRFAEEVIDNTLQCKINPVYIDEIGPLELSGMGFYNLFSKCLKKSSDIFTVVRENCLPDVIEKFDIAMDSYRIYQIS